jgi:hypothetical protein
MKTYCRGMGQRGLPDERGCHNQKGRDWRRGAAVAQRQSEPREVVPGRDAFMLRFHETFLSVLSPSSASLILRDTVGHVLEFCVGDGNDSTRLEQDVPAKALTEEKAFNSTERCSIAVNGPPFLVLRDRMRGCATEKKQACPAIEH